MTLPSQLMCAEITNIDIVCDNVMLTEPITLLDYEWTFEFPVPCEYVRIGSFTIIFRQTVSGHL